MIASLKYAPHELSKIFPAMSAEEKRELAADIKKHGLHHALSSSAWLPILQTVGHAVEGMGFSRVIDVFLVAVAPLQCWNRPNRVDVKGARGRNSPLIFHVRNSISSGSAPIVMRKVCSLD